MIKLSTPRQIILNGAPRSGESSIAAFIQDTFEGVWMNLGVDEAELPTLAWAQSVDPATTILVKPASSG